MKTAYEVSQEQTIYGCSEADMIKGAEAIDYPGSKLIWCAGACSDAQELMALAAREPDAMKRAEFLETARQFLNRAKWGMKRYLNDGR